LAANQEKIRPLQTLFLCEDSAPTSGTKNIIGGDTSELGAINCRPNVIHEMYRKQSSPFCLIAEIFELGSSISIYVGKISGCFTLN
jgi:hypothetical protein